MITPNAEDLDEGFKTYTFMRYLSLISFKMAVMASRVSLSWIRMFFIIILLHFASETTRPIAAMPLQGYCQPYRGMTCSNFISNHSIYVTDFQAQNLIEDRLTRAFLLMAPYLSPKCQQYAIPSLCFFAFPFCDETRQEPRGRELCRDECEILERDICKTEYHIIKEMPNVILPDCSRLPAIGTNASANCIRVGLPDVAAVTAGVVPYDVVSRSDDVMSMVNERALDFMDDMMSCTTNRTFLETLFDFGFYGCYCGFGGSGEPVDGVDRCCQAHDACYGATHSHWGEQPEGDGGECYINLAAYATPYKFTLHQCGTNDAYVTCADIHKYKWYNFLPRCAVAICNCNRIFAQCIAREPFHEENRFHNRLKCFEGDDDDKNGDENDDEDGDEIDHD